MSRIAVKHSRRQTMMQSRQKSDGIYRCPKAKERANQSVAASGSLVFYFASRHLFFPLLMTPSISAVVRLMMKKPAKSSLSLP